MNQFNGDDELVALFLDDKQDIVLQYPIPTDRTVLVSFAWINVDLVIKFRGSAYPADE